MSLSSSRKDDVDGAIFRGWGGKGGLFRKVVGIPKSSPRSKQAQGNSLVEVERAVSKVARSTNSRNMWGTTPPSGNRNWSTPELCRESLL